MVLDPELIRRARLFAGLATGAAAVIGATGFLGWVIGSPALKTGFAGGVTMKANTAIALVLTAAGLFWLLPPLRPRWRVHAGRAAGLVAGLIGAVTLSEHVFGWDAGIDELLFTEPLGEFATASPGRIGPPASASFLLLGSGLWWFDRRSASGAATSQWLALVAMPIATLAILGYLTGATELYGIARYTGIAPQTAVALFLLGAALLLARAEAAPVAIIVADNAGGEVARRMLPAAIFIPLVVGWLRTVGQNRGLYDSAFGRALLLMVLIVVFTTICWRVAWRLGSVAAARAAAEAAGRRAEAEATLLAEQRAALLVSERAARLEAERAANLKDQFLATLSHELRTPLNAILGWTTIARKSTESGALRKPLEVIERNARAQAKLIEDLLDISRIVSGKLRLDMQVVEVAGVIQSALGAVSPAAEAKRIAIESDIDPALGALTADATRLEQIVVNLLTNAVKFTPAGGSVRVRARRHDHHLEIRVADTGCGIAAEFLPHVFDRFRQADSTTTRRHGGLGLGLSIVKQLVELHGGNVVAESGGLGQGAAFTATLPLDVEGAVPAPPLLVTGAVRDDLAGVRVLVVDDESDAREFVARVLTDIDAIVELAAGVDDALAAVERETPQVLISDIAMPGKDGYDLIRAVRERFDAKTLPAIAVSAFARAEDRIQALQAGFQLHMAKPVEPNELATAVASLAGRTGTGA